MLSSRYHLLTHISLSMYIGSFVQKQADDFYMSSRWRLVKGRGCILAIKDKSNGNKVLK